MYSIDNMRSCIRAWFSASTDIMDVVKTYNVIQKESEKQIEYKIKELAERKNMLEDAAYHTNEHAKDVE